MSISFRQGRKKTRLRLHELEQALFGTVQQQGAQQHEMSRHQTEISQVKTTMISLLARGFWGRM